MHAQASSWRFNKLAFRGDHDGAFDPHACGDYLPPPPLPSELIAAQVTTTVRLITIRHREGDGL